MHYYLIYPIYLLKCIDIKSNYPHHLHLISNIGYCTTIRYIFFELKGFKSKQSLLSSFGIYHPFYHNYPNYRQLISNIRYCSTILIIRYIFFQLRGFKSNYPHYLHLISNIRYCTTISIIRYIFLNLKTVSQTILYIAIWYLISDIITTILIIFNWYLISDIALLSQLSDISSQI